MDPGVAVDVVGVSKRFRLYHEKYSSLKEKVIHAGHTPYEDFWALRDVRFSIAEGETVGMVGRNGSGKSTLLKCVAGILQPTAGEVVVRGQVAALLELGAGFQPELSGRDNVYLNGTLLGLSTKEIERRFDEIVAFAELEQFIDNQVRFYSSGMAVRLGFAIAVNVDPDIFVVDEVLAVGDENFQRKCLARIAEFQHEGRTILFVTHSADLVTQICDRAVVLSQGKVIGMGPAAEAIELYHRHLADLTDAGEALESTGVVPAGDGSGPGPFTITAVHLSHPGTGERLHLLPGEPLTVTVDYEAAQDLAGMVVGVEVVDQAGDLVMAGDTASAGQHLEVATGRGHLDIRFGRVPLLDGSYSVRIQPELPGSGSSFPGCATSFEVLNPGPVRGRVNLEFSTEVRAASS